MGGRKRRRLPSLWWSNTNYNTNNTRFTLVFLSAILTFLLLLALANHLIPSPIPKSTSPARDRFGIKELYPTSPNGIEWTSKWDDGQEHTFKNDVDPMDNWFSTEDGEGVYFIDGKGKLTASGDYARMYVYDPNKMREWSENLEITLYVYRIKETEVVDYSGLQVFARTNHGTNADEDINHCDDRGYGGLLNINGEWAFEKETAHHLENGYDDLAVQRPSGDLSKYSWVGFKFVLRNMDEGAKVKLELYRDLTGGLNGGNWQKMTEFIDDGQNFGVRHGACRPYINPALPLVHAFVDGSSETGKPMLAVYARHEFGTMAYSNFSIREIVP